MEKSIQIGQCRIYVEEAKTKAFYLNQPLITENCKCGNCKYFGNKVVLKNIRLFNNLKAMGVILERQPNINPDGVSCIEDTENFERGYMGNYKIFGKFGKTQKEPKILDDKGELKSVRFEEKQKDFYCSYEILRVSDTELNFQFWLEIDRKI